MKCGTFTASPFSNYGNTFELFIELFLGQLLKVQDTHTLHHTVYMPGNNILYNLIENNFFCIDIFLVLSPPLSWIISITKGIILYQILIKYTATTQYQQFFKILQHCMVQDWCSNKNWQLNFQYPTLFSTVQMLTFSGDVISLKIKLNILQVRFQIDQKITFQSFHIKS